GTVILRDKAGTGVATRIAQPPRNVTLPWTAVGGGLAVIAVVLVAAILLRAPSSDSGTNSSSSTEIPVTLAAGPTKDSQFAESMTQGPLIFKDNFGPDRGDLIWPTSTDHPDKVYENIEPGVGYHIRHTLMNTALPVLFDEEHAYGPGFEYEADLTIKVDSQG